MATFKISTDVLCTVAADGKTRLSKDFHVRLLKRVHECLEKSNGTVVLTKVLEQTPSQLRMSLCLSGGYKGYNEFNNRLTAELKSMTEYGRDSDIMHAVLAKYPHLKGHPRVNELVGSFDMLSAKITELDGDKKSKASQATPPLAKPGKGGAKSKKELRESREEKLSGNAPDQVQTASKNTGGDLKHLITPTTTIQRGTANVFDSGGK